MYSLRLKAVGLFGHKANVHVTRFVEDLNEQK